ncbi:MAG: tRNA pseudouridine(38-40) synthase TruA [Clostridia bacterium]|nr:tRNA pseudouridine(38-40) synthase TruA [Clostridia bacterium]
MSRILLKIAYDGTEYHGWQVQPNGITIQEVLCSKLSQMYKSNISLTGCSRTDAGVHANEFYCHFDQPFIIKEEGIIKGLNSVLPKNIAVFSAETVADDFHSRYSAKEKNYIYRILNSKIHDPFRENRVWHIERDINLNAINEFCKKICGEHDFYAFSSSGRTVSDTVRCVTECNAEKQGDEIVFSITANGFLYNMVRIIVGTAVEVSDGKIQLENIEKAFETKDRSILGITAPPQGLYLNKVFY